MNETIETVIIRSQQKFDLHEVFNPLEIVINDDRILNILKKQNHLLQTDTSWCFDSVIHNK